MFQAVQDLITSLQTGNDISSAVGEINNAYNFINQQRVFYGNAVNRLNSQQTFLNSQSTQLAQQQNTLGGADLLQVISNLVNAQVSRQATLEAVAQTQSTDLFNFIK
jgi:flagellin-like hook-associated protein FlgL